MTNEINICRIWGDGYSASGYTIPDPSQAIVKDSRRAGGGYKILGSTRPYINKLSDTEKAQLTTILIDQRMRGDKLPLVTPDLIEASRNRDSLPAHERAERLLIPFHPDCAVNAGYKLCIVIPAKAGIQ